MLFKDRAFNLSILFSSIWHLLWISIIAIVITPSIESGRPYQDVDFLGPVLEKTAFDLMVEEVKPQTETLYAQTALFVDDVYLKPKGPKRKILEEFMPRILSDRFTFSVAEYVKDTKEVPLYFKEAIEKRHRETKRKPPEPLLIIEGPASEREVIFQPASLTVPHGLYGDSPRYIVKLKFFISSNGIVYDVEPLVSSGYPKVDLEAIRSLKRWRFSPLSLVEKDKFSWGVITLKVITE